MSNSANSNTNIAVGVLVQGILRGHRGKEREPNCGVRKEPAYHGLTKDGLELIVKNIARRSGVSKHITPHVLRHTTATIALQSGMPIADISALLGHESIDTTMIYAQASLDAVRARHQKHIV